MGASANSRSTIGRSVAAMKPLERCAGSSGVPKRPAGIVASRARFASSTLLPDFFALNSMLARSRSVHIAPGSRLLIVTLCMAVLRASPAMKPVSPVRAPFDSPSSAIGIFTALEVMLTMRPNLRSIIGSITALISSIGVSMLAFNAWIQVSRVHSRKSPGGGPPALLTRMSGLGHAASAAARPSGVVMSPATVVTFVPVALRISSAVASSDSRPRAMITSSTPSRASDIAQPLPSPLDAAHTSAVLPRIPSSMPAPCQSTHFTA